jgi:trimeric autotransporter adhesin
MKLSKSSIQFKFTPALLIIFTLGSFAICQSAHAVVPAPDGGYPGGNTAEGQNALFSLTTGGYNTAVGYLSLRSDTTGSFNTAVGAGALFSNTADQNTALGAAAGLSLTTGSSNICIGSGVIGTASDNNTIRIGDNLPNQGSNCYIGGIYGELPGLGESAVYIGSNNKLGIIMSSRRFKYDIQPMNKVSEAILALKPVTFHYKSDAKNTPYFGLIAEEVAAANPALVVADKEGKPYTVRYEAVNAMLLNEFLKEHRKVQKLEAALDAITTRLEEQETELRKVRAQIQMNKSARRVASRD